MNTAGFVTIITILQRPSLPLISFAEMEDHTSPGHIQGKIIQRRDIGEDELPSLYPYLLSCTGVQNTRRRSYLQPLCPPTGYCQQPTRIANERQMTEVNDDEFACRPVASESLSVGSFANSQHIVNAQ